MLIFERPHAEPFNPQTIPTLPDSFPAHLRRRQPAGLPQVPELQVVRHYTGLSQRNMSVDTHVYPLGSCTMKYNPVICHEIATLAGFVQRHPCDDPQAMQGLLQSLYELQKRLAQITGMADFSLTPAAGAQGEWAGMAMIRAYHQSRNDMARSEVLIPAAAHGTNPATAVMCGYRVIEIPVQADGDLNLAALSDLLGPRTAAIMLTNPSTLGVFERQIGAIAERVHAAGGLLYYDGANLNALLGIVRPGEMGFDAMHVNLHKTFATPHGGGGPGAGAVGVGPRLVPFLPIPHVAYAATRGYYWQGRDEIPRTIGRLSTFGGQMGILIRAYTYILRLGDAGLRRVGQYATLNANYLQQRLKEEGFELPYGMRRASHEFVVSLAKESQKFGLSAQLCAKNLLDRGIHAPTVYFPQLVSECLLIEPTETEALGDLERLVDALCDIRELARTHPDVIQSAPHRMSVGRLDETRAARELDLTWQENNVTTLQKTE